MAAFSSHHQPPFIVPDSGYVPNTSNEMSGLLEQQVINTTTCFSPIHPSKGLQESPLNVHIHGFLDSSNIIKQYIDSSSMVPELETGDNQATQVVTHLKKKRKTMGCCKVDRQGKCKKENDGMSKNGEEKKLKAERKEKEKKKKKKMKVPEEAPTGYVLVRAKRGQATDSHSLAERARREKISERMRLLQSLVPGCDKITGKALILDEIINYVQSLQNQVEFLVMKLASVYPMFNDLDTNTPASEDFRNLEPTLPSVPQSDSMELRTTVTGVAPISTSFLHHLHQRSIFLSQDDGDLLGDIDYQTQKLADHYGHSNLCTI